MACASGAFHTITLSNDGIAYSFGHNDFGQLGHYNNVSLPSRIPRLPKIKQVSCGWNFAVCVDEEGFLWSFGQNNKGQLGTGNTIDFTVPQKILDIPPVFCVACGPSHTLIITNDSTLWSCGKNDYGQLCLGNKKDQFTFQQTTFSNIIKVSLGGYHSLFQNDRGEIYACGINDNGQLGLGIFQNQITPILIPNLPSNIIQFVCGNLQSLFLDLEGNVFSVGDNQFGQLGLGHNIHQNVLTKIPNIPPIQTISCVFHSSYLIDSEGNLWSFGNNGHGQLGHGDVTNRNVPTKIESLKGIEQISYGPCGYHFLAKDSESTIFLMGSNYSGQLGIENTESFLNPEKMAPEYFAIWGEVIKTKAKSARK